jgi:nitrous oxide reductase accessory protein NosL
MRRLFVLGMSFLLAVAAAQASGAAGQCDGCGMYLAPYGKTLHRLTLDTGGPRSFCGFGCLAEALETTPAAKGARIEVADFATGKLVDARKAAYVEGSDSPPVMSHVSLVAFASPAAAADYRKTHGGTPTDLTRALEQHRQGGGHVVAAAPAGDALPAPVFAPLPKPGKKIPIDQDRYFIFSFDRKPSMDTAILKVEVYTKDDRKDTSLEVRGNADMPSMKCQSGRPDRSFKLSKKGDYLLPFTFGMPGDWEVYLTFLRGDTAIFRGKHAFEI